MPSRKEDQSSGDKTAGSKLASWFRRNKSSKQQDDAKQHEDPKREQQLQAYVAWINSHLKKKPGCKQIQDLRKDIADGISLVNLVEVISGETLPDINRTPMTQAAKKDNTEKVLQYMIARKIRMYETSAKDIMDGSLKAIMRLILALAAHFKPSTSSRHLPPDRVSLQSGMTTSLVYTNPAVSPSVSKQQNQHNTGHVDYSSSLSPFNGYSGNGAEQGDVIDVRYDGPSPVRPSVYREMEPGGGGVRITRAKDRFQLIDLDSSVASSMCIDPVKNGRTNGRRLSDMFQWPSPDIKRAMIPSPQVRKKGSPRKRKSSTEHSPGKVRSYPSYDSSKQPMKLDHYQHAYPMNQPAFTVSFSDQNLDKTLSTFNFTSSANNEQSVTTDGSMLSKKKVKDEEEASETDEEDEVVTENSDTEIMPVLLDEDDEIERELIDVKSFLYGLQHLLLSSDAPENAVIPTDDVQLKNELTLSLAEADQLRYKMKSIEIEKEKAEKTEESLRAQNQILETRLDAQEEVITQLRADLLRYTLAKQPLDETSQTQEQRNESLQELRAQLICRDNAVDQLHKQLDEATRRIVDLDMVQESLQAKLQAKEAEIQEFHTKSDTSQSQRIPNHNGSSSPEVCNTDQARHNSRKSDGFRTPVGIHDDFATIQGELKWLKTSLSRTNPQQCQTVEELEHAVSLLIDKIDALDTTNMSQRKQTLKDSEIMRSTKKNNYRHGDTSSHVSSLSLVSTKAVYYLGRATTPFVTTIPKRLGEITLRDFRHAFDRPGNYRFRFKASDHEFGVVKQEIFHDDDVVPGWEGQIVVWIEENSCV